METLFTHIKAILFKHKYIHFFATGASGVAINLLITWFLTTFVFGLSRYFTAYVIGTAFNLLYNFTLHTLITFKTTSRHFRRLIGFITYSLVFAFFQTMFVKYVVSKVGVHYYLVVIATTIFVFSTVTFLVFKFFLFRESRSETSV